MLLFLLACDADPTIKESTTDTSGPDEGVDGDKDGFGESEGDCNDGDSAVNPSATEVCDGIDNNCDGTVDEGVTQTFYADADGDGFGDTAAPQTACEATDGFVENDGDCDDSQYGVNPASAEVCDNIDNNCDGQTDEDLTALWFADADGDGYGDVNAFQRTCEQPAGFIADATDCDDSTGRVSPGQLEVCDNLDNDCNGVVDDGVQTVWYADFDSDGYGSPVLSQTGCTAPAGYVENALDCDDNTAGSNPGALEVCNGADDDCDGTADEPDAADATIWYADADVDGYGDPAVSQPACDQPPGYTARALDCDDSRAAVNPAGLEVCDGIDNDCDGTVDIGAIDASTWYVDLDSDGYGSLAATQVSCAQPAGYVATADDCNDASALASPAGVEVCDNLDNDCSGQVDGADAIDAATWFADADGDGYGDLSASAISCTQPSGYVSSYSDCDDGSLSVYPSAPEYCNSIDDDCDGTVDDAAADALIWYADADSDGYGDAGSRITSCSQPAGYTSNSTDCDDVDNSVHPGADEHCDGDDEDCDGSVDESAVDMTVWYPDADGDSYGNPRLPISSCAQPPGYLTDNTDCDDADGDVHPGANEEWFDGVDSDCDGSEDPDACVEEPPAGTVSTASCTYTPTVGSFSPTLEWSVSSFSSQANFKHVLMTPVVGNLTDDNADGRIGEGDIPDIAFVAFSRASGAGSDGMLRIWSGDGSSEHVAVRGTPYGGQTYYPYRYSQLAMGDIDNDGQTEIAAIVYRTTGNCYIGAYGSTGALEWVYTGATTPCRSSAPAIADLEGDGDVEVIVGRTFLNGSNGTAHATGTGGYGYYSPYANSGMIAVPVDIDRDGEMEVIAGNTVYNANGTTQCSTGTTDGYAAVANLDADINGEFVVVAGGTIKVFDTGCSQLYSFAVYGGAASSNYGGPPTIADFDGDGTPEIGVAGSTYYTVYEINGSRLWAKAIDDSSSHSTGSSVFDFEGDGAAEVVYADENQLWVLDGRTGTVRINDSRHTSGTINEYPVIADVDNDGNAEIVVANDNTTYGIMVIGDAGDNWVSARHVWNQHAYSIVNINDDLTVPATQDPNWPDYNSFRQGSPGSFSATDAPDLYPLSYGSCQSACGQAVEVLLQVANEGALLAGSSLDIDLYGVASNGSRTLLDTVPLGTDLDPGDLSAVYRFTVPAATVLSYASIIAVVDADAEANECDEADNEVIVETAGVCL